MNVRPLALSEPYWSGEQFRWQTLVSGQDCNAFAVHHIKAHGPCHHVRCGIIPLVPCKTLSEGL